MGQPSASPWGWPFGLMGWQPSAVLDPEAGLEGCGSCGGLGAVPGAGPVATLLLGRFVARLDTAPGDPPLQLFLQEDLVAGPASVASANPFFFFFFKNSDFVRICLWDTV